MTLYLDLAEQLRNTIADGTFPAGEELPSERQLALRFGAHRDTVRDALRVLVGEGLVVKRPGAPATVAAKPERHPVDLRPGAVVIARMPTPRECADLGIEPAGGVPVLVVRGGAEGDQVYPAHAVTLRTE